MGAFICVFRLTPDPENLFKKTDPDPEHKSEDYITLCTLPGKFKFF